MGIMEEWAMRDNHSGNADEGADPSDDIKKQNPGEITTADLARGIAPKGTDGKGAASPPSGD